MVKWREHNPVSWFLCWLFESDSTDWIWSIDWLADILYKLHNWFCPDCDEEEWEKER